MKGKEVKKMRAMYALCDAAMVSAYNDLDNMKKALKNSTQRTAQFYKYSTPEIIEVNELKFRENLKACISNLEQAALSYSTLKEYYKHQIEEHTGYSPLTPGLPEENEILAIINAGDYNLPEAVKNVYAGKENISKYSPILAVYKRRGYRKIQKESVAIAG